MIVDGVEDDHALVTGGWDDFEGLEEGLVEGFEEGFGPNIANRGCAGLDLAILFLGGDSGMKS